ncbi:cilia- and flagella-associated protein 99-like isoform X2 [Entelurus aequoreus]|uniref:cilia- and flagella-associated protein 99-like isoform X2 n=1 Tax=Entelurus aequoreus TaxID=161455 RepID=UPI002B1E4111|nr:cilia- and flagella-associated protein 99-like isoform X2 [Entelurus aequoreus]
MAKSNGDLVNEAIELLDKFNAGKQSLDDFIEDAVKDLQNMEPQHRKFILDLVSGCTEYKKLLEVVVNPFYGQGGKLISKCYYSHFVVICYLTIFYFEDLGLQEFSNIVKSLDIRKMHNFLGFFFTNLTTWIQDEWNCIYDIAYVKDHWIAPLLRKRNEIEALMEKLAAKESEGIQPHKTPCKTTKFEAFSFVKPKPLFPPKSTPSPIVEKYKPIPKSTYNTPKEIQLLEVIKQRNHQMTEELLRKNNMTQFRCTNLTKSERTQRVLYQISEELESRLKFDSIHYVKPPPIKNVSPIKVNTAAMLRRRALYDRHMEEALQRIESLVQGAHEPSVLLQRQREMREREFHERWARIDLNHADANLSHWEATLARTQTVERNKKAAQLKKIEASKRCQKNAQKKLEEVKEKKDLVHKVIESYNNSTKAKERVNKFKQSAVKEFAEHNQELVRQAQEEAKAAHIKRLEFINEVHTMECLPTHRNNTFDDTEIAGHELLSEMSHVELKERLFLTKEAKIYEKQAKRQYIQEEKQRKKTQLSENMDTVILQSRAMAKAAAIRKEGEKQAKLRLQRVATQDKKVLALQKKLEEVKKECQKLKQSESNVNKSPKQAASHTVETHNEDGMQKMNWEDLEKRLEQYIGGKDSQR